MKKLVPFLFFIVVCVFPLSAQTYDQYAAQPDGTCTATGSANVGWSRYTRSAVSYATNTVQCSGTFNGKVTAQVGIQYQALWLLNQDPSTATGVDTYSWKSNTWPKFGPNPNCTIDLLTTTCPPGEEPTIMTEPIPSTATLTTSASGSACFRSVAKVTWKETFRYPWGSSTTYTRTLTSYSNWTGNDCSM